MLADMLSDQYAVLEASNGMEAIGILEKQRDQVSLVLLDIVMPEMNGFEVLAFLGKSEALKDIPVIMISAETSSAYIDQAYDLGACDYISRPFDEKTVRRRVKNTIMLYAKQKLLEAMVAEQVLEKERNSFLMVEILSTIVEFRNGESGLHVLHIRTITELLLRRLVRITDRYPLTATQIALVVNASSLHDIGKISIPEHILNKPGKLTPEEFEVMKTHSAVGAQILEKASFRRDEALVRVARDICRWHHERYDGGGYPDGLAGDDIPIAAQVVALADVYDALTNERVYKPAYTHEAAMGMILEGECGAFNPILLQCLIEMGPRIAEEVSRAAPAISSSQATLLSNRLLSSAKASTRTLALLEQERTKYQFFASMSQEIQFEFDLGADLLTLSDWGANQLGLPELIPHPHRNPELCRILRREDILDLHGQLQEATPENPFVHATYALNSHGQSRWYKVVARPLWVGDEETAVMTGTIGKFIDVHEERLQMDALKKRAEQDPLTHLHNHMSAREAIERKLVQDGAGSYALILFDLDLFKTANDRYGHMFGDEVLKDVARRIGGSIRAQDIAARVGGDEFLIFTACPRDPKPLVDRLFRAITGPCAGFPVSLSMGVAICPQDGNHYELLFHRADQALYAAKQRGRNRYCFYDPSARGTLSVLSPMESDLDDPRNKHVELTGP